MTGARVNYFSYDALQRRLAVQEASGLSYFTWDQNNIIMDCDSAYSQEAQRARFAEAGPRGSSVTGTIAPR